MSPVLPTVKLNSGYAIPAIGIGVYCGTDPKDHAAAVTWLLPALKAGYTHIDTAWIYGTEKSVGEAIRQSGIPREELWVTTKLPWHHAGRVEESIDQSLKNAGLDYFDLYLIHWPQVIAYEDNNPMPFDAEGSIKLATDAPSIEETWAEMEKVLASGKVQNIGVSNFSIKTLKPLLKSAKVVPATNQVELHPYLAQNDLLEYCKSKGIVLTAYTATGYATVREDPTIVSLASKYKVSPAQIILAWHASRGTITVPKSTNPERQKENINLPNLAPEDIKTIDGLDRGERLCNKAGEDGKVWGWTYEQLGW